MVDHATDRVLAHRQDTGHLRYGLHNPWNPVVYALDHGLSFTKHADASSTLRSRRKVDTQVVWSPLPGRLPEQYDQFVWQSPLIHLREVLTQDLPDTAFFLYLGLH